MITITLILASYRDYFKTIKDNKECADWIKEIEKCLYSSKSNECRLQLVGETKDIFKRLVDGEPIDIDKPSILEKRFLSAKKTSIHM